MEDVLLTSHCMLTVVCLACRMMYMDRMSTNSSSGNNDSTRMSLQAFGVQTMFDRIRWWEALAVHHAQQRQNLKGGSDNSQQADTTGKIWLKRLFKMGKDPSIAQQHNNVDILSDVDMSRMHLQLQQLEKIQREVGLIQCTFETGPSMWTKS